MKTSLEMFALTFNVNKPSVKKEDERTIARNEQEPML